METEFNFNFRFNNYGEFRNFIVKEIENFIPKKYMKNHMMNIVHFDGKNNEKLEGISFLDVRAIFDETKKQAPVFPIKYLYEHYKKEGFKDVIDMITNMLTSIKIESSVQSIDEVKDNIAFDICKTINNEKMLKNIPHREIFDLSIYYNIVLNNVEKGNTKTISGFLADNDFLASINTTEDELFSIALENIKKHKRVISFYDDVYKHASSHIDFSLESKMMQKAVLKDVYILTTDIGMGGLALMIDFNTLRELSEEMDDDFLITPLSANDFAILPFSIYKDMDVITSTRDMILSITNRENEIFTDRLYLYKRSENNIFQHKELMK